MKAAILSLVTVGALAFSAGTADARPPRPFVRTAPVYNYSYYNAPRYGGYYTPSYVYPAGGFSFNTGGFGLSVGNGYAYPYYGYGNSYYARPYYGGYNRGYYGGYRGWRW